jgi:hypothetical protein
MSLNRAVAALGAVAVVGALTVGFSVYQAHDAGKPEARAYVTAGSTWASLSPVCYNGGKLLTTAQVTACIKTIRTKATVDSARVIPAHPNTTFTIGVDQSVADKSWSASIGGATLVAGTTSFQANNLPLSSVFTTTTDQTTGAQTTATQGAVLVVAGKGGIDSTYGVWLFTLKTVS